MSNHQHKDDNGNTAPVFKRRDGLAHNEILVANDPTLITFDSKTKIVSFWAEGTVFLKFGGAAVVATTNDHALPAGLIDYEPLTNNNGEIIKTHVSVIAPEGTIFHLSERD